MEEALNAEDLDEELCGLYRSATMRLAYLSQDRPGLLVLGKELAKRLKGPTVAHFQVLKRGVRYQRANPRIVHLFPNQTQFTNLELWVDADHAGCSRSRKSTTGTALQLGKCTIRTTCKSQAVIALSSGEAEYYGLVFWTLPSTWRTVYSPRLGNQGFYRRLHGCHDGTFDRVQTWIRKGQAY